MIGLEAQQSRCITFLTGALVHRVYRKFMVCVAHRLHAVYNFPKHEFPYTHTECSNATVLVYFKMEL